MEGIHLIIFNTQLLNILSIILDFIQNELHLLVILHMLEPCHESLVQLIDLLNSVVLLFRWINVKSLCLVDRLEILIIICRKGNFFHFLEYNVIQILPSQSASRVERPRLFCQLYTYRQVLRRFPLAH